MERSEKERSSATLKWSVGWGFAGTCNMRCSFCYSKGVREPKLEPREPASYLRFIEANGHLIDSINWGTSENAMLDEWFDLVEQIGEVAPQSTQGVTTNGFLGARCSKDERCLQVLRDYLRDIDVSLDFASPGEHNRFRGNKSAYQWALDTLSLCKHHDIPRSIVTVSCQETMTPRNIEGLLGIAEQFDANLRINILRPVSDCGLTVVPYATIREFLVWMLDNAQVVSLADPLFAAQVELIAPDPTGTSSLRILPDGSVTPSTYLVTPPWIAANIFEENICLDSLSAYQPFAALSEAPIPIACKGCLVREACRGGCKDRRVLWYGDLAERDPYCPKRHEDGHRWFDPSRIRHRQKRGPLIHDGYLPTLIFAP